MDLEMPGPTRFRGPLVSYSVESRTVNETTDIDSALRNILRTVQKCAKTSKEDVGTSGDVRKNDTLKHRIIVRQAAVESIVLLKNERGVLPINPQSKFRLALIGPRVEHPSYSGGGSADLPSYYSVSPMEGISTVFRGDIKYHVGCYGELPSLSV
jgi:beta-glucosidase